MKILTHGQKETRKFLIFSFCQYSFPSVSYFFRLVTASPGYVLRFN